MFSFKIDNKQDINVILFKKERSELCKRNRIKCVGFKESKCRFVSKISKKKCKTYINNHLLRSKMQKTWI